MTRGMRDAGDIARSLSRRVEALVRELLPGGHREGAEWRCGSVTGEPGSSLGVRVGAGPKRGVWADFATGERGDALDLVRTALGLDMSGALTWSRRWLGRTEGDTELSGSAPAPPASLLRTCPLPR